MTLPQQSVEQFYTFITERENIRLRRLHGWPREQWTLDPIFQTYSFTNVKREHDRVTTLLKREFYDPFTECRISAQLESGDPEVDNWDVGECQEILLNAALFRLTGTIESARTMGWTDWWDPHSRQRILDLGIQNDLTFTAAYIVPNCGRSQPKYEIVLEIVDGIWGLDSAMHVKSGWQAESIILKMANDGWQAATAELTALWGVGSFIAKEILLDYVLATDEKPNDWQTWTPVGPGGQRGASRVKYGVDDKIPEEEALDVIRELYESRKQHWRNDFVELELTDIQFQLCEFDKYSRVAEGRKPKRRFKPTVDSVTKRKTEDL